jgi:hypothetical protein
LKTYIYKENSIEHIVGASHVKLWGNKGLGMPQGVLKAII